MGGCYRLELDFYLDFFFWDFDFGLLKVILKKSRNQEMLTDFLKVSPISLKSSLDLLKNEGLILILVENRNRQIKKKIAPRFLFEVGFLWLRWIFWDWGGAFLIELFKARICKVKIRQLFKDQAYQFSGALFDFGDHETFIFRVA